MFSVYCDHHHAEVLRGPRSIIGMSHTDDGVVLTYRCLCGAIGTVLTGGDGRWERLQHADAARQPARAA